MKALLIAISMFALANTASAKQLIVRDKKVEILKLKVKTDECTAYAKVGDTYVYASGSTCAIAVARLIQKLQ